MIVGGMLYLLQESIAVPFSKVEQAGPPPTFNPISAPPSKTHFDIEPDILDPTNTQRVRAARVYRPHAPLLNPLISSAESGSLELEAQPARRHPIHVLDAPVIEAPRRVVTLHEPAVAQQASIRSQSLSLNEGLQPVAVSPVLPPDDVIVRTELEGSSLSPGGSAQLSSVAAALPPDGVVVSTELERSSSASDDVVREASLDISPPTLPVRRPTPRPEARDPKPTEKAVEPQAAKHAEPMRLGTDDRRVSPNPGTRRYQGTVWAKLARHKPATDQRGSATVSFAINPRGGLAFVRLTGSSGNPHIDRLALATVRRATPFPAPPKELQARPYTIRIEFR